MRDVNLAATLRSLLESARADDTPDAGELASRGVVVNGRGGALTIVGSVINIHAAPRDDRTAALSGASNIERRRAICREIRIRLSEQPMIRRGFATWLSSMHGVRDVMELDDETLNTALAWVRQRTE